MVNPTDIAGNEKKKKKKKQKKKTKKMKVRSWLTCQSPAVSGSALGLVGPVSIYCYWVR